MKYKLQIHGHDDMEYTILQEGDVFSVIETRYDRFYVEEEKIRTCSSQDEAKDWVIKKIAKLQKLYGNLGIRIESGTHEMNEKEVHDLMSTISLNND